METTYYQKILQQELARRCARNPRYSLRAFSKVLEMDVSGLSRILNNKKVPTKRMVEKILTAIDMSPDERKKFEESLIAHQRKKKLEKVNQSLADNDGTKKETFNLDSEIFQVIADWYHYAILELTFLPEFRPEPQWISKKLNISYAEAQLALTRLVELGLLKKNDSSQLVKSENDLTMTDTHHVNAALVRRNKQILQKALESMDKHSVSKRSASTMTMAIDPSKMELAKEMILQFKRQLCDVLESGERKQVYELTINLFPLSNEGDCL